MAKGKKKNTNHSLSIISDLLTLKHPVDIHFFIVSHGSK